MRDAPSLTPGFPLWAVEAILAERAARVAEPGAGTKARGWFRRGTARGDLETGGWHKELNDYAGDHFDSSVTSWCNFR